MTRFLLIAIIFSLSSVSYSQDTFVPVEGNDSATLVVDSFSVYNEYVRRLDTLVAWRDSIKREIRFSARQKLLNTSSKRVQKSMRLMNRAELL